MAEPARRTPPQAARDLLLVAGTILLVCAAMAMSDELVSPAATGPTPVQERLDAETTALAADPNTVPTADSLGLGDREEALDSDPAMPRRFDSRDFLLRTGWWPFDRRDGHGALGDPSASFASGRYGLAQSSPPAPRSTSQH